ncbi:MAG TPA: universal stress protein [Thermomicrobiales bacterium]|nr:universal stress protein [Thermomicrobiales bacterium]
MKTIVVPLDGSELSEQAIGLGLSLARAWNAPLSLVHVLEEPVLLDLLPGLALPNREDAEAYLRDVAATLPLDIAVSTHVLRGNPAATILDLTEDEPETVVVMSTHGRGGMRRLFGSVAGKVVHEAMTPVALVRSPATLHNQRLESILVPLDASNFSETALPVAADLARRTGATLGLTHVCEPFWVSPGVASIPELAQINAARMSDVERESLNDARAYLDRVAGYLRSEGIRVVWEVRFGRPADEIMRAAETTGADLVVMATHDRRGLQRLALGSVTNEVLQHGPTPVLTIPPRLIEQRQRDAADMLSTF